LLAANLFINNTLPTASDTTASERPADVAQRVAWLSRFQTRYRLYRLCGWSRIAALVTVLRHRRDQSA
jgi:hypothetical protein